MIYVAVWLTFGILFLLFRVLTQMFTHKFSVENDVTMALLLFWLMAGVIATIIRLIYLIWR
jgi:ABC-type thiamin/hydroxymethylpyrimidine transport system permease subunit